MQSEFSEQTYGFCYGANFISIFENGYQILPDLPSARAEKFNPYDARFSLDNGINLFMQFKIPHLVQGKNGFNSKTWNWFSGPHLRYQLRTMGSENQHNTLYDFALVRPNQVFYCSPIIIKKMELLNLFLSKALIEHSRYVRPESTRRFEDGNQHHIGYSTDGKRWRYFSEEGDIHPLTFVELIRDAPRVKLNLDYFSGLEHEILDFLEGHDFNHIYDEVHEENLLVRISYLLNNYLGLDWFIIKYPFSTDNNHQEREEFEDTNSLSRGRVIAMRRRMGL